MKFLCNPAFQFTGLKDPIHTSHLLTSPQKVEVIEDLPDTFINFLETRLKKKLLCIKFKSVYNHAYS